MVSKGHLKKFKIKQKIHKFLLISSKKLKCSLIEKVVYSQTNFISFMFKVYIYINI